MTRQVPATAPRPAAGALLLSLLARGCWAERAWMLAERATPAADQKAEAQGGGPLGSVLQNLQRRGTPHAAAAPGNDTSEETRFAEHLHARGTPPDALERAAERLDPAGSAAGGGLVTEAAPLPDEFVAACSMKNDTDPKQVLVRLHGCTEALDRFAAEAKSAHGRSREANSQYVQKFREVMEHLLALKDMKNFHEAFDKDDEAALQVLLGEASKSKDEIETLGPSP